MRLLCVLVRFVSKIVRKTLEKRNWLVFLPNVQCKIETFSRVLLALGKFLALLHYALFHWCFLFFLKFFYFSLRGKTRGQIKNASETTHSVIRPFI